MSPKIDKKSKGDLFRKNLLAYAKLSMQQEREKLNDDEKARKEETAAMLEVSKIVLVLDGVERMQQILGRLEYPAERSGYVALLTSLFDMPTIWNSNGQIVWQTYLHQLDTESDAIPESHEELLHAIVRWYTAHVRPFIMPILFDGAFDLVDKALAGLHPRDEKVLCMRFGIREARSYTLKEIGTEFHLSVERTRQIQERALRKLRYKHPRLETFIRPIGNILSESFAREKKRKETEKDLEACSKSDGTIPLSVLLTELIQMEDWSVRTMNSFQGKWDEHHPRFLGQLIQLSEVDLLRRKQFGRKCLREVEIVLEERGLHLNTILSAETKKAFDEALGR